MSLAQANDQSQLSRFFETLQSEASAWLLFKSNLPFLKRHAEEVIAVCSGTLPGRNVVALRSTIVLIALGEKPDLGVLEDAYMSETGRGVVAASYLADVVPKGPYPELLALAERVTERSRNAYAVTLSVRLAIQLRGSAVESDIAALERIHAAQPKFQLDSTLWSFLNRARGPLKSRGLELFDRLLETNLDSPGIIAFFAPHADESRIPRLYSLLSRFGHPDLSGSRQHLVMALVRLKAPGARETLFDELAQDNYVPIVGHLAELLRGTNDEEAIGKLLDRFATIKRGTYHGKDFAQAVAAIGGPGTLPIVERLIDGLPEHLKSQARLEARGMSLDAALDELRSVGFITDDQRKRAIARRRQTNLSARIVDALEAAGAAFRFDAEYSGTPVPHDRLLLDLARLSGAAFTPDDVSQEGPESGAETDAYVVRFRHGSRSYEFSCGDQSGWYDHRSVAEHVNGALQDAGIGARFIQIDLDGQYPTYVFTDPGAAGEAAHRGLIVLPPTNVSV